MPTHPVCAKMTKMPRGKFPNRSPVKHCLSTNLGCARHNSRLKSWLCSRWHEMSFFIKGTIAVSAVVTAVHHCYGSAVPSVQWRHGNYAIRKFLSSLGNFCSAIIGGASAIGINSIALGLLNKSSRMVCHHAKNVPTEPMGSPPLESPRQRGQSRACPDYAKCSRGKTVGQTPIRLYEKPYTPIVPQAKAPCL